MVAKRLISNNFGNCKLLLNNLQQNFYSNKENEKQDTAKERQKWIERYVKRGALTNEDILFLGNQKYGSYLDTDIVIL